MNFNELNDEQKIAVMQQGNVLLTACPGSGKTRIIIHKLAHELLTLEDFEKNKEEKNDVVFYSFSPKYSINSALVNILSIKNRDKNYVLANVKKDVIKISCRSQSGKINCPELLRKCIQGIPDSVAGGHLKAAGASIPLGYLEKFKENLFKEI